MAPPQKRSQAPPMPKGQQYMVVMMLLMVFILFNPGFSKQLGGAMAVVLTPAIGFGGREPVLSILLAGLITGLLSTVLRHFSTDYVGLERGRILQRTFNKDLMEARAKGDVDRAERLRKAQPYLMSHTMSAQYQTMKPAVYTMVVALAVYGWMFHFLTETVHTTGISLPWASYWPLQAGSLQMMFLYAVMSLPATLVTSHALRLWRFRNFDPDAPLPHIPTVQDLLRRADGEIDDDKVVKREADKARKRLRGEAATEEAEDGEIEDGEIEDEEHDDIEIVDADEAAEADAEGGDEGEPSEGKASPAKTAPPANEDPDASPRDGDEE